MILCGGNMASKRETLEAVGRFDPKINLCADAAITFKIRRYGRIKIDRSSIVKTSTRRLKRGALKSAARYYLNFFCLLVFNRPFFLDFPDIREKI